MTSRFHLLPALLVLLAACDRPGVETYIVPKPLDGTPAAAAPAMPDLPAPPAVGGRAGLKWTAPERWTAEAASGMRRGSYKAAADGGMADVSIIVLDGAAGGPLANVNRWRGQIGLAPFGADAFEKSVRRVRPRAIPQELLVVDLLGEGQPRPRTMAAILERGGQTWFFKMTGPESAVARAKDEFFSLLESLRPDGSAS